MRENRFKASALSAKGLARSSCVGTSIDRYGSTMEVCSAADPSLWSRFPWSPRRITSVFGCAVSTCSSSAASGASMRANLETMRGRTGSVAESVRDESFTRFGPHTTTQICSQVRVHHCLSFFTRESFLPSFLLSFLSLFLYFSLSLSLILLSSPPIYPTNLSRSSWPMHV